jgi:hypothetical protein
MYLGKYFYGLKIQLVINGYLSPDRITKYTQTYTYAQCLKKYSDKCN